MGYVINTGAKLEFLPAVTKTALQNGQILVVGGIAIGPIDRSNDPLLTLTPFDNVSLANPYTLQQISPFEIDNVSESGIHSFLVTSLTTDPIRTIRVIIETPDLTAEWVEVQGFTDGTGQTQSLFDQFLSDAEKVCFDASASRSPFSKESGSCTSGIEVFTVTSSSSTSGTVVLEQPWSALNSTSCGVSQFCEIFSNPNGRYDVSIGSFNSGAVNIRILPHLNAPPEVEPFDSLAVRGIPLLIDLSLHATDADGDPLIYFIDNQSTIGTTSSII